MIWFCEDNIMNKELIIKEINIDNLDDYNDIKTKNICLIIGQVR